MSPRLYKLIKTGETKGQFKELILMDGTYRVLVWDRYFDQAAIMFETNIKQNALNYFDSLED